MQVVNRKLDELVPYVGNSRTHSPAQVKQVEASLLEFGWCSTISTDGQAGILAGHCRVQAAVNLMKNPAAVIPNWPDKTVAPTIDLSHLSKTQQKAYIIADNKLAMNAGWNEDLLASEMEGLLDEGFDIGTIGFSEDELAALFGIVPSEGLTDPDDVPEPPVNPIAVEGDVWLCGNHRLACGSSTDEHTVAKVLNGVKPHLMVTDPPYGVEYDASWRLSAMPEKNTKNGSHGKVMNDSRADWSEAWALFPGEVAYVWCAPGPLNCSVHDSLNNSGLVPRMQIVWVKNQFVLGRGHYHAQHENCWYAVRKGGTGHWAGDRKQTTVWQINKPTKSETGHSTQKPVECMQRPIENNSSPGQAIYEPFSGSGTTIIAGEITGRSVHAIELNPAYIDVAVKRWQDYTGQEATLEGDGRTFNEMCEVRYAGGDWAKNAKGSYDDAVDAAHKQRNGKAAAAE